ncbi:hypothetical protein V1503_06095 [Bacillus sp. SCS-151]|uniref:hypothetical protein n=1 Tax=Nanhaiella sioensis TaxID=3115293 RepID=UPI00397C1A28
MTCICRQASEHRSLSPAVLNTVYRIILTQAEGISNGERLGEACTRAQVVTMLYRALANNK